MMDQDDQGWDFSDKFVCACCVDDYALSCAIAAEASDDQCSFCGRSPASQMDVLLNAFMAGILNEYIDVDNAGVPYDSGEGGYQFYAGEGFDSSDLIDEFGDVLTGEGLIEEVRDRIHSKLWVDQNYGSASRDEILHDAWGAFSYAVKYVTRYVIWLLDHSEEKGWRSSDILPPAKILHNIGELLDDVGVMRVLSHGSEVWRARTHQGETLSPDICADHLGTVKREHSKRPNRMNPAGIPMFYGAVDSCTAIAEVSENVPKKHNHVTVGQFALSHDVAVVDLTRIPPIPSIFDPNFGPLRREISFLHNFAKEISIPVEESDKAIEYVPTQIMTEFFLRVFRPKGGGEIVGLMYESAVRKGGISLVLDIGSERCLDCNADMPQSPSLILDSHSVATRAIPDA